MKDGKRRDDQLTGDGFDGEFTGNAELPEGVRTKYVSSRSALSSSEIELILDSLKHTKLERESTEYQSYELRRQRIEEIESVIEKVRALR